MNCLNISLVDSRGDGARAKAGARAGPKFEFGELGVVELDLFRALSPCAMALLSVESLFSLLGVVKSCERFF